MEKDEILWECVQIHLPDWIDQYSIELSACVTRKEHDQLMGLLDSYNNLIDREESDDEDGFSLYGVEDEKQDIINSILKIYDRHKEAAFNLRKHKQ